MNPENPLDEKTLYNIDAYWRASNYLAVGQIYLCDNPLLKEPLQLEHVKKLLLGHWGTTPGQNFIYTHLNRVIKNHDLNMIYISPRKKQVLNNCSSGFSSPVAWRDTFHHKFLVRYMKVES